MSVWKVRRAPLIEREIRVPGDKSISHRAVILAAISNGTCVITGFLPSEDCMCTVNAMIALGVRIEQPEPTICPSCKAPLGANHDYDCPEAQE